MIQLLSLYYYIRCRRLHNKMKMERMYTLALFTIGDLHLSFSTDKAMDIFQGWENYVENLEQNWKNKIADDDTVVLVGDTSWAMGLEQSLADFQFIHSLPGRKVVIKGNHDYWWATLGKMQAFLNANGLSSIEILHNNCAQAGDKIICGTRGWMVENGGEFDEKLVRREAARLEASLAASKGLEGERIAFLHYPPVYGGHSLSEIITVLHQYGVRRCYYGHIHGSGARYAITGDYRGIDFHLIAADFINFNPVLVP